MNPATTISAEIKPIILLILIFLPMKLTPCGLIEFIGFVEFVGFIEFVEYPKQHNQRDSREKRA
jgi:uncharacterized protein involved in cysteine biosynthesis